MHEIAQMTQVYANSILNIGAAHAKGPHEGCFADRDRILNPPECFSWTPSSLQPEQVFQIYQSFEVHKEFYYLRRENRLFERAWVLQERLLSPRMLHFGRSQLYWECEEISPACETYPWGIHIPANHPRELPPFSLDAKDLRDGKMESWRHALEDYSGLILSRPTEDKLVAIGGIAKRVAEITDDRYIAGLFKRRFIEHLCWKADLSCNSAPKWRAPSWSWASVDGHTTFRRDIFAGGLAEMVSLREVRAETLDPKNPFGPLKAASLRLQGRLVDVFAPSRWSSSITILLAHGVDKEGVPGPIGREVHDFQCMLDGHNLGLSMPPRVYMLPLGLKLSDWKDTKLMNHYLNNPAQVEYPPGEVEMQGLLLQRTSEGSFRRIGFIERRPTGLSARSFRRLLELWATKEEELITLV